MPKASSIVMVVLAAIVLSIWLITVGERLELDSIGTWVACLSIGVIAGIICGLLYSSDD